MFRPCIDLHRGKVKQIVGSTFSADEAGLQTNFVSERPSSWFAGLYRQDSLFGGHVIMLGPGNEVAACSALRAFPGGLQIGGGITPDNAFAFLDAGASQIIATSWLFDEGQFNFEKLTVLSTLIGQNRLVMDLSCRPQGSRYFVTANRWQTVTSLEITAESLKNIGDYCSEFLVHAVDVEGLCQGIDWELVDILTQASPLPVTYAGGAKSLDDLCLVHQRSNGRVDLTIGSALDIFGGSGIRYADAVAFNRSLQTSKNPCPASPKR